MALNFAQSLVNRNGQSTLTVHDDLQLFINFHHQLLLHQSLALLALLDHLAHLQGHLVVMQLLSLPVQLGHVLGDRMLFVLASGTFLGNLHISSSESLRWLAGLGPHGYGAFLSSMLTVTQSFSATVEWAGPGAPRQLHILCILTQFRATYCMIPLA